MDYSQILKEFDRQIWWQKKSYGQEEKCPSYWRKMIFIESHDLGIDDWREIRSGNYYDARDSLFDVNRDKFILKRILEYKSRF